MQMADEHHWHLPISSEVHQLVLGQVRPRDAVRRLMERDLKEERLSLQR
jgi:glycerol-3-phosphate dehydrogenase